MKNTMRWLGLALVCVALLAFAPGVLADDDFEAAYTNDNVPQQQQVTGPVINQNNGVGRQDTQNNQQNHSSNQQQNDGSVSVVPVVPKFMPSPEMEDMQATINNGGTPGLPSDAIPGEMYVRVFSKTPSPRIGDRVKLFAYVWNAPVGQQLFYQWQEDNGSGWTNIPQASQIDYEFDYNQITLHNHYRVCIDTVPFLN